MSMDVSVVQRRSHWQILQAANSANTTAIAVRIATETKPITGTDRTIITPRRSLVEFSFFGTDADNETANISIIKWSELIDESPALWIPCHLCEVVVTFASAITGATGHIPSTSDFFADTITRTNGALGIEIIDGDPNITPAGLIVDPGGCELLEIFGDRGTGATWNGMWRDIG